MKKYKTEYKVATGKIIEFEKEINALSVDGWIWCGSLTAVLLEAGGLEYSLLMSRTTEVEDVQQK